MNKRIEDTLRSAIFSFYTKTGLYNRLKVGERMFFCHVGYISGHVSMIDEIYAKNEGLKPLAGITLWMMKPIIAFEKAMRQVEWSQTINDTLGE